MKTATLTRDLPTHLCQSWLEGNLVYYSCPVCGFVKTFDWKTGEWATLNHGDQNALHRGRYSGYVVQFEMVNQEN